MRSECKDTAGEATAGIKGLSERVRSTRGNARMAQAEGKGRRDEGTGGTQSVYTPTPNFGQSTPN